jgi:hypothetical protein
LSIARRAVSSAKVASKCVCARVPF